MKNELAKNKRQKRLWLITCFIFAVFFIIAGFVFFSYKNIMYGRLNFAKNREYSVIKQNKIKNDACLDCVRRNLDGEYAKPGEENLYPIAVIIENLVEARPQSGLSRASLVFEAEAEGNITRFLAFYQSVLPEKIGPIRSAREYYLVLAKEMGDAMLMHHGYSPQALVAIETWPVRSLQRGAAPYWRENPRNVAIEHTLYASGKEVVKKGLELGWEGKSANFYVWQFKDDATAYSAMPQATTIAYDFWYPGDFSAEWTYDSATNDYFRFMGYDSVGKSVPHIDETTNQQLKVKNLIVQFATETKIAGDDKNRLDYEFVGSGKGYVFIDGRAIEVTWSKAERDARTKYYDMNGSEIRFNRGKFWVSVLPDRNPDFLKFSAEAAPKTN